MRGCRGLRDTIRGFALVGLLTLYGAPAGMPAHAFEPPPGSKNFTTPSSVPNYFSNEAAPFGRGSRTAAPGADRFNTPTRPLPTQTAVSIPRPVSAAAANTGQATNQGRVARGGTGRSKQATSRTSQTRHAGKARGRPKAVSTRAASRKSVSAKQRTGGKNRPRHATRGSGQTGRSTR